MTSLTLFERCHTFIFKGFFSFHFSDKILVYWGCVAGTWVISNVYWVTKIKIVLCYKLKLKVLARIQRN